jgi:hypothetical protein
VNLPEVKALRQVGKAAEMGMSYGGVQSGRWSRKEIDGNRVVPPYAIGRVISRDNCGVEKTLSECQRDKDWNREFTYIPATVITTTVHDDEPPKPEDTRSILERKIKITPCEDWVKLVDAQIKEFIDASSSYDTAGRHEAVMKTIHDMGINEGDFMRWVEAARKKPSLHYGGYLSP